MTASAKADHASETLYPVPAGFAATAKIDASGYAAAYRRSVEDPAGFWAEAGAAIRGARRVRLSGGVRGDLF